VVLHAEPLDHPFQRLLGLGERVREQCIPSLEIGDLPPQLAVLDRSPLLFGLVDLLLTSHLVGPPLLS
jgi:hypothetical protein